MVCLYYIVTLCENVNLIEMKKVKVLVTQLCPIPCDLMDCSLPGSSIHGILQGRKLGVVYCSLLHRIFQSQD